MIKIMKKIWIPGIFMLLLLTACGTPDAVADELKKVSALAGFTGSKDDATAFSDMLEQEEVHSEEKTISEELDKRLGVLVAFLEKKEKEKKIRAVSYDYEDDDVDYEDEEDDVEYHVVEEHLIFENLKDWRSAKAQQDGIAANFEMSIGAADDVMKGLEEIGFDGLSLPGSEDESYRCDIISHGVNFNIEYNKGPEPYFDVDISVEGYSIEYPAKYEELLGNYMRNAFAPSNIQCGGYLEYIRFHGSYMNLANNYSKRVEIFFREGKPIQTNLSVGSDFDRQGGDLLTEEEKKDLTGLLTWLSGDGKASEKFISELGNIKDKEGNIGSLNWYQISSIQSGECVIRFEPASKS